MTPLFPFLGGHEPTTALSTRRRLPRRDHLPHPPCPVSPAALPAVEPNRHRCARPCPAPLRRPDPPRLASLESFPYLSNLPRRPSDGRLHAPSEHQPLHGHFAASPSEV